MNETERKIADDLYAAIQHSSNWSTRSLQAKSFRVGLSDLGFCSERSRRMLKQEVPEERDMLAAFIGTAIGDHVEAAAKHIWPDAITQSEVSVQLEGDGGLYTIAGHPDIVLPNHGIVLDCKTSFGLTHVRRTGPSQQQQFQRHAYGKGAWLAGMFKGIPLDQIRVGNVWLDRGGVDKELHVQLERYDEGVLVAAGQWLDDVVYAYINGEEARKEPPRELCAVACGFYEPCRGGDTDVEGLLTDENVLVSVDMYQEGVTLEREGRKLKDRAKVALNGIQGSTGDYLVRWTVVNDTEVSYHRSAYSKLDVKPVPGGKK